MPLPTCPTDCSSALPVVDFDKCAPKINISEIRRIFVGRANIQPFTDWLTAAEWTERLSETDVANANAIRPLTVIADKPAPAAVNKDISNGRTFIIGKDHTVNWTIDDVSPENYEFMRQLECGGIYRIWYETMGGYLYGGNDGIEAKLSGDDILNRGADEIETLAGTATWRDKFHPERGLSPIFDSDYSQPVVPPEG